MNVLIASPLEPEFADRVRAVDGVEVLYAAVRSGPCNVVLSPHTAALSTRENARIVDILIDNLGRLARGEGLRNALNLTEFY